MAIRDILVVLGAVAGVYLVVKFLSFVWLYLRPSGLPRYIHGVKPWALITGSTGDIGQGFAEILCEKGCNVAIHGRSKDKLDRQKQELCRKYPDAEIQTILLDVFTATPADIEAAIKPIKDLNLTILVNNAGGPIGVNPLAKDLINFTAEETDGVIDLNIRFPTQLTRLLLPTLARNQPSLVLNIGSLGDMGLPYFAIYGAAKAYLNTLGKALNTEFRADRTDINVQTVVFGTVNNSNHRTPYPVSTFVPTARSAAQSALNRVGCSQPVVIASIMHAMQHWPVTLMSERLKRSVIIPTLKDIKEMYEKAE